ncbi:MAG TPA: AI-2E family transporter [Elainellaceae cyanobacterium]
MRFGSLVGFAALLISLYILWRIQQIVLLGFAAVVFATVINRLVKYLEQHKVKQGLALVLSVAFILVIAIVFIVLIVPPLVRQAMELVDLVPDGFQQLQEWISWIQNFLPEQVIEDVRGLSGIGGIVSNIQSWVSNLFGNFFQIFFSSIEFLLKLLLLIVVTLMFLANPSAYRHLCLQLFPSFYRRRADAILHQSEEALVGWFKGILFNMTVITVLSGMSLWILGVQLPLANAFLAGLLTFIPNVGPTISVIPPMAIALLDTPWKAIVVLGIYVAIQQIESNVLTPIMMEKQVSLLPALTLLLQASFAIFFGILGLFLALPIAVVGQVWIREIVIRDVFDKWKNNRLQASKPEQS